MDKCKCGHESIMHCSGGVGGCAVRDCMCKYFALEESESAKWKAKADKLAKALEGIASNLGRGSVHPSPCDALRARASSAIAEYRE